MRQFLETTAREAGVAILPFFGKIRKTQAKAFKGDLLTSADLLSDKIITRHIRKAYPADTVLSEEGKKIDLHSGRVWIIDPLDGTRNFATGFPIFGVMIAFADQGRVTASAVYFPCTKELFSAERGKGAFLNGKRISCKKDVLQGSYGCLEGKWAASGYSKVIKLLGPLTGCWVNMYACMALAGCSVACGRRDFMVNTSLPVWDNAAISLILEESGCKVTGLDGRPWTLKEPSLVAANPKLHKELMKRIRN